jgi:hypothetical protein
MAAGLFAYAVVSPMLLKDEIGQVIEGVETFRDMSQVEEFRKELDDRFQMRNMIGRSRKIKAFQIELSKIDGRACAIEQDFKYMQ